jgi:hypothetical protein
MAISARMINPSLQPNLLPYDTTKELAVVSHLALSCTTGCSSGRRCR